MTDTILLVDDALRELVGPATGLDVLRALRRAQNRKLLLQLEFTRRVLEREAPTLTRESGFEGGHACLKSLDKDELDSILSYPSFAQWCAVADELLSRSAHRNLAEGQIKSHLNLFATFPLAVQLKRGECAVMELWLDASGRLALPSLGCAIAGRFDDAGKRIRIEVASALRLCVTTPDGTDTLLDLAGAPHGRSPVRLRRASVVADRFEFNDYDLLLQDASSVLQGDLLEARSDESRARWDVVGKRAWDVLGNADANCAEEIGECVRVIVPWSESRKVGHGSSIGSASFGMIQIPWREQPEELAATLIFEYYRSKMNAILDLDPLTPDDATRSISFEPEGDGIRQHSVLESVLGLGGVARFWSTRCRSSTTSLDSRVAKARFEGSRARCLAALDMLTQDSRLTRTGTIVFEAVRDGVLALPNLKGARPSRRTAYGSGSDDPWRWKHRHSYVRPEIVEHVGKIWEAAGGRRAMRSETMGHYRPDSPELMDIAHELGIEAGIPVNQVQDDAARRDSSFDFLSLAFVRRREWFVQLERRILALETDSPFALRLKGHVEYVRERPVRAACFYSSCLLVYPNDLDTWRDFSFSLRHAQLPVESNVYLFSPHLVAMAAESLEIFGSPLRTLLGSEAVVPFGWESDHPAVLHVWLLRWLRLAFGSVEAALKSTASELPR